MLFGFLIVKNLYVIDKCSTFEANLNNQIDKIFKSIKSLETRIKPTTKYRLKSCIKRI